MRELTTRFVLAADEVWRLQGGRDGAAYRAAGGSDPECLSFQAMAGKGHYGPGAGSKQGIYVCTPAGEFLASVNSNDPQAVAAMLKKGLTAWRDLGSDSRSATAADVGPRHRWEGSYPEDGLVLQQTIRQLAVAGRGSFNRDQVWFSADEMRDFLPARLVPGESSVLPARLVRRLARHHLLDESRGEIGVFAAREVEGELAAEVLEVESGKVRLRLTGRSRGSRDPARGIHWHPGDVETRMLGSAIFDLERARFVAFELIAVGTSTRPARRGGPAPAPRSLGWLFQLAPRTGARVAPTHLGAYEADWVERPALRLHELTGR